MKKEAYFGVIGVFVLVLLGAGVTLAATENKTAEAKVMMQPLRPSTTTTVQTLPSWTEYLKKLKALRTEYKEKMKSERVAARENQEKLRQEYLAQLKAAKKGLSDKEAALKKELMEKEKVLKEQFKK